MLNQDPDPDPDPHPPPTRFPFGSARLSGRVRKLLPPFLPTVRLFAGVFILEILSFHCTADNIPPVWVSNAVAILVLLRNARIAWPGLLLVQIAADTLANLTINGFAVSLGSGLCDALEIVATAVALQSIAKDGAIFSSLGRIARFGAVCLTVPIFSAALGSVMLRVLLAAPFIGSWTSWYLGDMFGLLLMIPFLMLWTEPGRLSTMSRGELVEIILLTLLAGGVGWIDFSTLVLPGLFLAFPFLLLAALRGGLLGATSAAVALTIVASFLTLTGHGEIAAYPATVFGHLILLQLYFATVFLSSLPVAVLLEQRRLLSRFQTLTELSRMARHDPLTELPNRLLFRERLAEVQAQARQRGGHTALLMIDLDRFKPVNDRYGHAAGDRLLVLVGERLRGAVRESDTVARLGGDEFAIVGYVVEPQAAQIFAQRALAALSEPFSFMDITVQIGCSIGIGLNSAADGDVEGLIRRADTALYKVKSEGRNGFRFFEPGMDDAASRAALNGEPGPPVLRDQVMPDAV
jgi:diguanylate cyclase (GGDEF)-like protein